MMKGKDGLMILGMIRAKNADGYLPKLLTQMKIFCDGILLLDDNSVDNTVEVAREYGACVRLNTGVLGHDEGRDRRRLHEWAAQFSPDWIYAPDTDDLLEDGGPDLIRRLVKGAEQSGIEAFQFPYLYLWGDMKHYRVDGIYDSITAIRLFKFFPAFMPIARDVHSMAVGAEIIGRGKFCRSDIRLLHLGYMTAGQRSEKYEWHVKNFPPGTDGYKWAGGRGYEHILGRDAEIREL
jgi:glycosyltransferase involved in cell wall biosynthesis